MSLELRQCEACGRGPRWLTFELFGGALLWICRSCKRKPAFNQRAENSQAKATE